MLIVYVQLAYVKGFFMVDMKKVGERLQEERQRLGLKQSDVMYKVNITQATLSRYEHGKRMPTLEACLGFYLVGYDLIYLLTGNRDNTSLSTDNLSTDEQQWLSLYQQSTDKLTLLKLVKAFESIKN